MTNLNDLPTVFFKQNLDVFYIADIKGKSFFVNHLNIFVFLIL